MKSERGSRRSKLSKRRSRRIRHDMRLCIKRRSMRSTVGSERVSRRGRHQRHVARSSHSTI